MESISKDLQNYIKYQYIFLTQMQARKITVLPTIHVIMAKISYRTITFSLFSLNFSVE